MKSSNLKKKMKELNKWFHKYINGTKGVISIYLIICMLPTISLNFLLTEGVRYQSALQMLEELIDNAGVSTLAEYDKYLDERFGTMALDQEAKIEENFSKYFDENVKSIGKSVTVDSKSVTGAYALANEDILKQQILEYSEVMGPAKFIYEAGDLEELLNKLQEDLPGKIGEIKEIADKTDKAASLAKEVVDLLDKITKVVTQYEEYDVAYSDYISKYETFKTDILSVKDKVKAVSESEDEVEEIENKLVTKRAELEQAVEDEDEEKIESLEKEIEDLEEDLEDAEEAQATAESNQSHAVTKVKNSRDSYKSSASTLKTKTQSLGDTITVLQTKASSISQGILDVDDDTPDPNSTSTATQSASNYIIEEIQQLTNLIELHIGSNYSDSVTTAVNNLVDQQEILRNFRVDDIENSWTEQTVKNLYGPYDRILDGAFITAISEIAVGISGVVNDDYRNEMTAFMDMVDLIQAILSLDVLYDLGLNAYVDGGNMHTSVAANQYATTLTSSLNSLLGTIDDFTDSVNNGDFDTKDKSFFDKVVDFVKDVFGAILDYYAAIVKVLVAAVSFLKAILEIIVNIFGQIANMFGAGWGELYNSLLITVYGVYNFPCRTNFNSEKTLSGYPYEKIFAMAGGESSRLAQLGGALSGMGSPGGATVSKDMFFGAEVEYLIAGTNSEVDNQTAVFAVLYLIRFVVDIYPISKNASNRTMIDAANAATGGIAGTIIQILQYIAEPFVDTIMLVNGGTVYFLKEQPYLVPDGITTLLTDFNTLLKKTASSQTTENFKAEIDNLKKEWDEDPESSAEGWMLMDYKEHAMVILFLTVNQDTLLKRMQNIMQMEAAHYYRDVVNFDLDKAYTYIDTEVQGQLNLMLPTERLTENGLFTFNRQQYTGY